MNERPITFGSLFAGSGAFDLGLVRAGLTCLWQIERDRHCRTLLERHFPGVDRHADILDVDPSDLARVDVICGGDPCPFRSNAKSIHGTTSPDLFPEFLRIVRALRPLWVLRENVVSPDIDECGGMLRDLGYEPIILECDSAEVTGQSRQREYLCGVLASSGICPGRTFFEPTGDRGASATSGEAGHVATCLTAHHKRYDTVENYILEPGSGLRILASVERERLQGLPDGWTAGISSRQRAKVAGNAVTRSFPQWIGRKIMEHKNSCTSSC
jgi:DNA (cytosine-5)-methyltransferase 1